jgi:hypothetical protein
MVLVVAADRDWGSYLAPIIAHVFYYAKGVGARAELLHAGVAGSEGKLSDSGVDHLECRG